jgi:hypothetical protein
LSGLAVILKAEGIERHPKGSFRELRIDYYQKAFTDNCTLTTKKKGGGAGQPKF